MTKKEIFSARLQLPRRWKTTWAGPNSSGQNMCVNRTSVEYVGTWLQLLPWPLLDTMFGIESQNDPESPATHFALGCQDSAFWKVT